MNIKSVANVVVMGFAMLMMGTMLSGCKEDYSDPKAFFDKYFMEDWFNPRYGSAFYQKSMRFKEVRVDNLRLEASMGMTAVCADVRIIPEPGTVYINKRGKPWHILTTESWDTSLSGSKLDGDTYLRAKVTIRRVKLDNGVFVPSEEVRNRNGLMYAVEGFYFLDDLRVYKPADSIAMARMLKPLVEEVEKVAESKDTWAAYHAGRMLDEYVWTEYSCGNQFRFIHDRLLKQRLYVALKKLIIMSKWDADKLRNHKISKILWLLRDVDDSASGGKRDAGVGSSGERSSILDRILQKLGTQREESKSALSPKERLKLALSRADFEKAQNDAKVILETSPDDPSANFAMGMLFLTRKQWEGAEKHLLKCKAARPDDVAVWNNLAVVYRHMKRYDDAKVHAQKALSLAPDSKEVKNTVKRIEEAISSQSNR